MCITGCNDNSASSGPGPSSAPSPPSPPCDGTSVPCPSMTHAVLSLQSVTFTGGHTVDNDTAGTFGGPHWRSGRSTQEPVCYARGSTVECTAVFSVTTAPSAAEVVEVRGTATIGSSTLTWTGRGTVNPGSGTLTVASLRSSTTLPNHVDCLDPLRITWEFNPANTGWAAAGSSEVVVYVTLGAPSGTPAYWTLLDISCRAAIGETTAAGVKAQSYARIRTRSLKRKRDGHDLTYWNPDTTTATNCAQLLARPDGSGQCGSWSHFLIDMWRCHGITDADKIVVVPETSKGADGFLVKNWTFVNAGTKPAPWTWVLSSECVNAPGVPGQNNPEPPPAFQNHFIVYDGSDFYDPSYGSPTFTTTLAWENASIDALYKSVGGEYRAGHRKSASTSANLLEYMNTRTGATL